MYCKFRERFRNFWYYGDACNVSENDDSHFTKNEGKSLHVIKQTEFHEPIRDLHSFKNHIEPLVARVQQWNLLTTGTKVTRFRNRNKCFLLCKMKRVFEVIQIVLWKNWDMHITHANLKAVLLHYGNQRPFFPLAHADETNENMSFILVCMYVLSIN